MRPEQHPPLGLGSVAPEQDSLNGRFEVVVTDLVERHPAQLGERVLMAVDERLLALSAERLMHGTTAARQAQREQEHLRSHPAKIDPQIGEIDLGFRPGQMRLRDEPHSVARRASAAISGRRRAT